jgi:hypothetical protein
MKRLLAAILVLVPATAVADPFDQPWALITNDSDLAADPKLRPVIVSRVDGESVIKSRAVVGPGTRMVTVDLPPRKGFSLGTQENFELVASPCMRYHIAARLDTETGQRWVPVVRTAETIGECLTKFKGRAANK